MARFLRINPEEALRKTNNRFIARFQYMERHVAREGKDLQAMTALEWDTLWEAAKSQEKIKSHQASVSLETQDHAQDHE